MISGLPSYISIVFALTTLMAVYLFYKAAHNSKITLIILLLWLIVQSVISLKGFYTVTDSIPPRFVLLVWPPLIFILLLFIVPAGRRFLDRLDPGILTYLHTLRIPVELVLLLLFLHKLIPQSMTFEGRNFDIISGITAPFIAYFGYTKPQLSRTMLLIWNFICLGLLVNVVVIAILSAPFPFQTMSFDQPNVAVLYFPFTWLPCCMVPIVFLSHLAAIRQLMLARNYR